MLNYLLPDNLPSKYGFTSKFPRLSYPRGIGLSRSVQCLSLLCLSLSVPALTVAAQTAESPAKQSPVQTAPAPPNTGSPVAGSVMAQLSRELSAIVIQNREGVVVIRGYRQVTISPQNPAAPGAASAALLTAAALQISIVPVMGSGFLVQGDIVVTTAEVAQDIINPIVILGNNKPLRVLAKSLDLKTNIAIFKLAKSETDVARHTLPLGDSDSVLPGFLAVTIGNQAGFSPSGGLAFIAQTGQRARSGDRFYPTLIQFQGVVSPGSSGSPLIGPTGEVIGLVIAAPDTTQGGFRNGFFGGRNNHDSRFPSSSGSDKGARNDQKTRPSFSSPTPSTTPAPVSPLGGLSNIGFALPINTVKTHLEELIDTAQPVPARGWMGIVLGKDSKLGVLVRNLYKGCPAETSGLTIGDIVLQVDGEPIHSERDFNMVLRHTIEGQKLRMQIQRGNEMHTIVVRMIALPESEAMEKLSLREPTKSS